MMRTGKTIMMTYLLYYLHPRAKTATEPVVVETLRPKKTSPIWNLLAKAIVSMKTGGEVRLKDLPGLLTECI